MTLEIEKIKKADL